MMYYDTTRVTHTVVPPPSPLVSSQPHSPNAANTTHHPPPPQTMEDLPTLVKKGDHAGILSYVRTRKLREPALVVRSGTALLGPDVRRAGRGLDPADRLAVLEQVCLAALDEADPVLAEACLDQIRVAVPEGSARYRRLLGTCLEASGDYGAAEAEYDGLLEENPSCALALRRRYCLLRAQPGREVQAREALNALLEGGGGGDPAGWAELGRVALDAGDYASAAYAYEEVAVACPLSAEVHCTLGELYATLGGLPNLLLARKHLAQSLDLDPGGVRAMYALVAVAADYLDELARAGKRTRQGEADGEDGGADVARELIRYGTEGLLGMYRGTKMFAAVATVLQDMAS